MFSTDANATQLKFLSMLQIKLLNSEGIMLALGHQEVSKIGHLGVNDDGENDSRFSLKLKVL